MLKTVLAGAVLFSPLVANAETFTFKPDDNSVKFHAEGTPGFLSIDGESKAEGQVTTAPGGSYTGTVTVSLKGIKTGIGLRDTHLHEKYLETGKYPTAALKLDSGFKGPKSPFCGVLTLKGQSAPVCGEAEVTDEAGAAKRVKASFTVDLDKYPAIGVPSYTGVVVSKKVAVTVDALAAPKKG